MNISPFFAFCKKYNFAKRKKMLRFSVPKYLRKKRKEAEAVSASSICKVFFLKQDVTH
jgi:hypothetical protein